MLLDGALPRLCALDARDPKKTPPTMPSVETLWLDLAWFINPLNIMDWLWDFPGKERERYRECWGLRGNDLSGNCM